MEPKMNQMISLPYKILIGTHHKTGTAWLKSVFEEICRQYSLSFCACARNVVPDASCNVILNYHSAFDSNLTSSAYRGAHIIRDPRDVIISGCFYHQKSQEKWLYKPLEIIGGYTYHDKINSLGTLDDQLLLEMEVIGKITITDMLKWNYTNPSFFELKYESLIKDTGLVIFSNLFSFLGFKEESLPDLLCIVRKNSLFSNQAIDKSHVRSGETEQWKKYFKSIHKQRFLELFDDALVQLGYENDNSWIL
jgi:hypothetical protein